MKDTVMVFVRPYESPRLWATPEDVRIAYGDVWIDFRDGNVILRRENGKEIFSLEPKAP